MGIDDGERRDLWSLVLRHPLFLFDPSSLDILYCRFDLSDRYLNSIAVDAWLGAGQVSLFIRSFVSTPTDSSTSLQVEMADLTAALFVRDSEMPQPVSQTLFDMQVGLYLGIAFSPYLSLTNKC